MSDWVGIAMTIAVFVVLAGFAVWAEKKADDEIKAAFRRRLYRTPPS